jgi:succinate dehydrogenase/fumarate reductase flavoprotein subunit
MLNTLLTSLAVAYSALVRRESRGAHFRLDYSEEESHWAKNIRIFYKTIDLAVKYYRRTFNEFLAFGRFLVYSV